MTTELDAFIKEQIASRPIEARIIRKIVRSLSLAGEPVVSVWDGEESTPVSSITDVNRAVFNLDESYLYTANGSWVRVTMGQDWDMLTDYTYNLEEALKPVNDLIEVYANY